MEPFVPTPEERIIHQNSNGARAKAPPPPEPGEKQNPLKKLLANHGQLIGIAIILVLFLAILQTLQNQSIAQLERRLAGGATVQGSEIARATPAEGERGEAIAAVREQITGLAGLVAAQGEALQLLQARIEEIGTGGAVSDGLANEVDSASQALAQLQLRLDRVEAGVNKAGALDSRVATLETNMDEIRDGYGAAIDNNGEKVAALESSLTGFANQLNKQLNDKIAAIEENLSATKEQLNDQLQRVNDTLESKITLTTADLRNALEPRLSGLAQAHEAVDKELATYRGEIETARRHFNRELDARKKTFAVISPRLDRLETENTTLATSLGDTRRQIEALDSRLASPADGTMAQISELDSRLKAVNTNLTAKIDATTTRLADIDTRLASTAERTTARLSEFDSQLATNSRQEEIGGANQLDSALNSVRDRIATLTTQVDRTNSRLDDQASRVESVQAKLGQLASAESEAPPVEAMVELQEMLASQSEAMANLHARDDRLSRELTSSRTELEALQSAVTSLRQTSGGGASAVGTGEVEVIQGQLDALASRVDNAEKRIETDSTQIAAWRRQTESRLSTAASAGGGDTTDLKSVIRVLMKQHPYTDFPPLN